MTEGIITKFCGKCKKNLPVSGFSKDRRSRDGLQSRCKACSKAWRDANPEYQKAWHEARPEYRKAWRGANPEKVATHDKKWREANPEIRKAADHRRRARIRNAEGDHTAAQIRARTAVHGDSCIYCASTTSLHIDHIKPLAKGGSNWAANLAPACQSCNVSKRDRWGADLLAWVEQNCTVERTRRILSTVLG